MKPLWKKLVWIIPLAISAALGLAAMSAFIVMKLWNWLLPSLFGWHEITFWQALGFLILTKILFGGFRGRTGLTRRDGWRGRWQGMTPEEREAFRARMRTRCGWLRAATSGPDCSLAHTSVS